MKKICEFKNDFTGECAVLVKHDRMFYLDVKLAGGNFINSDFINEDNARKVYIDIVGDMVNMRMIDLAKYGINFE